MLIKRAEQVETHAMNMPGARGVKMRILLGRSDGAPTFAMRQFEVEPGGQTPQHQHNYEHQVVILAGQALVSGGVGCSTIRPANPGDVLLIPANELHQFRNASSEVLRFLCMIPVSFDCGNHQCQPTPGS